MALVKHVVEQCAKIKISNIVGSVNPNSINKLRWLFSFWIGKIVQCTMWSAEKKTDLMHQQAYSQVCNILAPERTRTMKPLFPSKLV